MSPVGNTASAWFPRSMQRGGVDVILFQRIGGGWEYRYTSDGETYRAFDYDPAQSRAQLLRRLGWDRGRFDRADFRRF